MAEQPELKTENAQKMFSKMSKQLPAGDFIVYDGLDDLEIPRAFMKIHNTFFDREVYRAAVQNIIQIPNPCLCDTNYKCNICRNLSNL